MVRMSKEFGLNPTIPQCVLCGEDKGSLALLGTAYKVDGKVARAPKHMVIDLEPCDKCFTRLRESRKVAILEMTYDDKKRVEPSGRIVEIAEESLKEIVPVPTFRVMLMFESQFQEV
ncbi:MAG: hypothetical protein ACWGQW_00540, partial [bacterium]